MLESSKKHTWMSVEVLSLRPQQVIFIIPRSWWPTLLKYERGRVTNGWRVSSNYTTYILVSPSCNIPTNNIWWDWSHQLHRAGLHEILIPTYILPQNHLIWELSWPNPCICCNKRPHFTPKEVLGHQLAGYLRWNSAIDVTWRTVDKGQIYQRAHWSLYRCRYFFGCC